MAGKMRNNANKRERTERTDRQTEEHRPTSRNDEETALLVDYGDSGKRRQYFPTFLREHLQQSVAFQNDLPYVARFSPILLSLDYYYLIKLLLLTFQDKLQYKVFD